MSRAAKEESRRRYKPLVDDLKDQGYTVTWFTQFQARINGRFDLYVSSGKWHDIKLDERGDSPDLVAWVKARILASKAATKRILAERHVFRLYNLKTAGWASDQRHMGDKAVTDCVSEKCIRVQAADPAARDMARRCLKVVREDEQDYIDRIQARFDAEYPRVAERRTAVC